MRDELPRRRDLAGVAALLVSIGVPVAVVASRVGLDVDAAHDEAVVRALGVAWTGVFRALDVVPASLFCALPLRTLAFRLGLAGAVLTGVAGGLLFALARRLLAAHVARARRASAASAALASLSATLTGAWVIEGSTAGSSMLGVVLALLPAVLAGDPRRRRSPLLALALGLALSYEPWVGIAALAGLSPWVAASKDEAPARSPAWTRALAFAAGWLPMCAAFAWGRVAPERLVTDTFASPLGEGAALGSRRALDLASAELGWLLVASAVAGAAWALAVGRSRRPGAAVVALLVACVAAVSVGVPAGPWRFGAPALLLIGAGAILAALPLQAALVGVAAARVPLAEVSAALVYVLALIFPLLTLDDADARAAARAAGGSRPWDAAAFDALPPGTLVLIGDRALYARALAARATGDLRADLAVVPVYDQSDPAFERGLGGDPALVPLLRDYALYEEPRERTLSSVAALRAVAFGPVPPWERALSRHLVPAGLFDVFSAEPRGGAERRATLADSAGALAALRATIVAPGDAALAALTARLLDARARALSSLGEKDAADGVAEDALSLALPGARGARRARRLVTSLLSRATSP